MQSVQTARKNRDDAEGQMFRVVGLLATELSLT